MSPAFFRIFGNHTQTILMDGKKLLAILLFTLSLNLCPAEEWSDSFRYTYFGISDGLCDDYVLSSFVDSDGYLWACTSNGLDRFDGYRFIHFNSHSEIPSTRLKDDFIYGVAEDGFRRIWVASRTGVSVIDKRDGSISYPEQMGKYAAVLSRPTISIRTATDGTLWLLQSKSVLHLIFDAEGNPSSVEECSLGKADPRCIAISGNTLIVGGFKGIECFSISASGKISQMDASRPFAAEIEISNVSYMLANGDYLWVGSEDGLFCINNSRKTMDSYRHDPSRPESLSDNHVTCLALDLSGDILVGTSKGIDLYTRSGQFSHMTQGRKNHSPNTNYINNIFVAEDGTMWVSTLVGGLNRISPKNVHMSDMLTVEEGEANIVSCCLEDSKGNLLTGILGKGLGIRLAGKDNFSIYSLKEYAGISQNDVFSIAEDNNGNYWISTRYDGLVFLDGKDLSYPSFRNYNTGNSSIGNDHIYDCIYDGKRNCLWYSTTDGLYRMDTDTGEGNRIKLATGSRQETRFYCLYLDDMGRLWAGGYGICMIDLSSVTDMDGAYEATYHRNLGAVPEDSAMERITSMTQTPDGTFYIGSQNNGLYRMTPEGEITGNIKVEGENLPMLKITKVFSDRSGNIWIGTSCGIVHYNTESGVMTHFNNHDGLAATSCYINSGCRMADDNIAFGTSNGLVIFKAPYTNVISGQPQIRISGITIGEQVSLWHSGREVEIYPKNTSFNITLTSLNLTEAERIRYSYKFNNDSQWDLSRNGRISFNSLSPGKHTLIARCTDTNGQWSEEQEIITFDVHPKFVQRAIFWIILFSVISGLAAAFVITKVKARAKIQKELTRQVEEKTADLTSAMHEIMDSKQSIEKQNVLLEEQKAKLEEYSASMEKANREKLMLYTNLTHEFKTPLSLILGPAAELKESVSGEEDLASVGIIERNAKYLLTLINQILDLRKVDAGEISIKKDSLNIQSFLSIFHTDFKNGMSMRGITFETNEHLVSNTIVSDRDVLYKIISNLLSNAYKYTPDGGKVTMNLAQFARPEDGKMIQYISVTNTGSYIEPEMRAKIFECYQKSDNREIHGLKAQGSSGIGLYLVKNLVTALGGHIAVSSSEKGWTSFRLYFPVELVDEHNSDSIPSEEATLTDMPVLLLVEDNEDMRHYIRRILADRFSIVEATNGEKGYELAKQVIPDFIISDLMMPVCDGLELCRRIRSDNTLSHIPFLMLTAISDDDTRLNSYREGVNAFLVKPFKKEMLIARIDNILNERKTQQEELSYDLENSYAKVNIDRSDKAFMEQLMNTLKENYSDPDFSVRKLQSMLLMSNTPFHKKISSLTGLTPTTLIRRYRLQTARKLLEENADKGISISEIAYMVGFSDPKYFSKCFLKDYHIKPSELLQQSGRVPEEEDSEE